MCLLFTNSIEKNLKLVEFASLILTLDLIDDKSHFCFRFVKCNESVGFILSTVYIGAAFEEDVYSKLWLLLLIVNVEFLLTSDCLVGNVVIISNKR